MIPRTGWLSQSRISQAGKCLFQYKLIHVDKLVRRWNPAPLRRGTLVHKGFEAALLWDWAARHLHGFGGTTAGIATAFPDHHLYKMLAIGERAIRMQQAAWLADPVVAPFVDEYMRETAARLVDDAVKIFRRSFTALGVHTGKWKTVSAPDGKPFIEYGMRLVFEGWEGFQGTLDWVAEDERGHLWLWDFKTRKALQPAEYDRLQIQAPCYQHLLRETLGVHLVGTITYQIRAANLQTPKMNKTRTKQPDGTMALGMSRSNVSTDWPTYRTALLENGLDPDDYLDMRDKLPAQFDRIEQYYRGETETTEIWNTVLAVVDNIENAHLHNRFPRNISPFTCRGCSHRSYCEAALQDEDLEALARTEYMREGETPTVQQVEFDDDD